MLEEIREITNVGTFRAFKPQTPIALRRLTLIYGPNGTGKTTLCAILRSLARNEPDLLKGRKTLNREGESRVELGLSNNGRCVWDGKAWSGDPPKIEIFDEQFVRDNLYTDTVEVDQKRNLLRVILGEHDAKIAKKVSKAARVSRKLQHKIRTLEREIDALVGNSKLGEDFLKLKEDPEIDAKIEEQRKRVAAHENAERVRREKGLDPLPLPEPLAGLDALLGRTFEELAADAEQLLQRHLDRCGDEPGHREWLERGLDYVKDDICPFCGQSVSGVELVHAYRTIFSQRYRAHKAEIEAMLAELERRFGGEASARFAAIVANNAERARFWEPYVASDWSILNARLDWKETWEGYYSAARAALDRKRSSPLEPVSAEELRQREQRLRTILKDLHKQNNTVATINSKIENVKNAARSDQLEAAKSELNRLKIVKKRHIPEVAALCNMCLSKRDCKDKVEERRQELQRELDGRSPDKLGACARRVNEILGSFNAGFVLHEIRKEQPSGDAAAGWKVAIRGKPIHLGEDRAPSEPNFKNTLSAGDRSALAFAFFLAQLEQKPDLGERIVVLDDPFTSQDWFRRNATKGCLVELTQRAGQVILVSHDSRFLLDVQKLIKTTKDIQSLELRFADEDGSRLLEEDVLFIARVTARADLQELRAFLERGVGRPIDIARKIRPVLEAALRRAYPNIVTSTMMLGQIVEIARRGEGPLREWSAQLSELNEYTRPYHHGEDTRDGAWPPIDSQELRSQVRKALAIGGPILDEKAS